MQSWTQAFLKKKKKSNNIKEYLLSAYYEPGNVHSLQCLQLLSKSLNPRENLRRWVLILSTLAQEGMETQGGEITKFDRAVQLRIPRRSPRAPPV